MSVFSFWLVSSAPFSSDPVAQFRFNVSNLHTISSRPLLSLNASLPLPPVLLPSHHFTSPVSSSSTLFSSGLLSSTPHAHAVQTRGSDSNTPPPPSSPLPSLWPHTDKWERLCSDSARKNNFWYSWPHHMEGHIWCKRAFATKYHTFRHRLTRRGVSLDADAPPASLYGQFWHLFFLPPTFFFLSVALLAPFTRGTVLHFWPHGETGWWGGWGSEGGKMVSLRGIQLHSRLSRETRSHIVPAWRV